MRTALLAPLASCLALAACRSPTQLTVDVSTDVPCRLQGTGIAVGVLGASLEGAPPASTTLTCDATGHVGALVVVPSGENDAPVAIKVVGGVDVSPDACTAESHFAGCIVARRALHFVPHENLRLEVPLRASCKNVPCAATETCVQGACVQATIASPEQCASSACDEGTLRAPGGDGGVDAGGGSDAGADADAQVADAEAGAILDASSLACGTTCGGRLALGAHHSCALASDDSVICWGVNTNGQLGRGGDTSITPKPVRVSAIDPLGPVVSIVAGVDRTCAFRSDGTVSCWGEMSGGVFGPASDGTFNFATRVSLLDNAVDIGVGKTHSCWRTSPTALFCIGDGTENALGTSAASSTTPVVPEVTGPFAQLASSDRWNCVVKADASLWCFGANGSTAADPSVPQISPTFPPKKVDVGVAFAEVRLGVDFTCARITPEGRIACWGDDNWSQLGADVDSGSRDEPVIVVGPDRKTPITGVAGFAAGYDHTCARMTDGRVMCWGADAFGNLGRGNVVVDTGQSFYADYVVDGAGGQLGGITSIAAGGDHTCAMKQNGEVWCWGRNADGEVGLPDTDPHSSPVRVSF